MDLFGHRPEGTEKERNGRRLLLTTPGVDQTLSAREKDHLGFLNTVVLQDARKEVHRTFDLQV